MLRRSVGGFGGSRRFFGTSRGNPVVLAPGIGRKIAAHTGGKAASPNQGDIQGALPLDHFCILFLIEKDVPARHERRTTCRWGISRLCVNRNAAAGIADSVADKTPGASSRPGRGPPTGGGSRVYVSIATQVRVPRQCFNQNSGRDLLTAGPPATAGGFRAVASFVTKARATRQCY